ncbi:Serine/threonine-protein kinase PknB [Symmachiella macrocystis]|uniref:Serine/threonine-protein kinase PknB n=1 Tax=Symmachiella macrocystis TaxID=2527985 RepID=A0A5C6BFP3_9PLAN|nr:serine/threonine-protein kinase [Symmachiella macrocystis]TWU09254.1 Serine/threonine-protein kinase PknB [Symmachiella macrocystis]
MSENESSIDNYKLSNCLSQGRHSQVWEANDSGSGRTVALKVLLPEAFADKEQKQILKLEAKVGKSLEHPNIIRVYECIVSRNHAYIAMELFRAPNAKVQLVSDKASIQRRAHKLIEQTAMALAHMHERGWIHKDVKPENILINKSSEVRLIDFSLSGKPAGSLGKMVNRKKKGFVQGTRTYMAPEQIRNQPLTHLVDMYGFGITVYEILAGRPPFRSPHPDNLLMDHLKTTPAPPSEFNDNITAEMDQIVLKMLAKSPKNRQSGIDEFLSEFRNVRIFKEALPEQAQRTEQEINEDKLKDQDAGIESRIDSRLDAMRTEALKNNPGGVKAPEKTKSKTVLKTEPIEKPKAPEPPAQQQPQQPPQQPSVQPPQPFPQPGMPLQAMTPEQMAMHQQMLQQQQAYYQQMMHQQSMQNQMYPQPGMQPPPGMQQPQMPAPPLQQQPPQPAASQPPQQPSAPAPVQEQPPQQKPAQKKPAPSKEQKPPKKETEGTIMSIDDMEDIFKTLPDV